MSTFIRKGYYGWTADTTSPLGDGHALKITTMKRSNGKVETTATRVKLQDGGGYSFVVFQDFNVRAASEAMRCTDKNVERQHHEVLARLDEIKAQCAAHYQAVAA